MLELFFLVVFIAGILFFIYLFSGGNAFTTSGRDSKGRFTGNRKEVGRKAGADWAVEVLKRPDNYVILDTETTGLGETDEIIQLAIIDLQGRTLFDSLIKPTKGKRISPKAQSIHGITRESLKGAPAFCDVADQVLAILDSKTVITYNAEYDSRLFMQTLKKYPDVQLSREYVIRGKWECAMLYYSAYIGEWWASKQDYKWQKLPAGDHTALGDCKATLDVIHKMAELKEASA